jgi:uncharacterized phage protein (TIGR02216 family)
MLRTALAMGLVPEVFWRLSLREWRMLTEAVPGVAPMGRVEMERLAKAWPDSPPPSGEVARRDFAT